MKKYKDYIWDYDIRYQSYNENGGYVTSRTTDSSKDAFNFCNAIKEHIESVVYKGTEIYNSSKNKPNELMDILRGKCN